MTALHDSAAWMQPSTCTRRRDAAAAPRVTPQCLPAVPPVGGGFDGVGHTIKLSLTAVALATVMAGCAQAPSPNPVRVEPVYRLAHSDSARVAGLPMPTVVRQGDVDAKRVERSISQADLMSRAWAGNPEALHVLGVSLAQQGQLAEGVAALRLANSKAPGQSRLLNNLGYALQLQGQTEQAQVMYEAALLADPSYDRARLNLVALAALRAAPVVQPMVEVSESTATLLQVVEAEPATTTTAISLAAEPALATTAVESPVVSPVVATVVTETGLAEPVTVAQLEGLAVAAPAAFAAMAAPERVESGDVAVNDVMSSVPEATDTAPSPSDVVQAFAQQMLAMLALPAEPVTPVVSELAAAVRAPEPVAAVEAVMETRDVRSPQPSAAPRGVQVEVFNGNGLIGAGGALRIWLRERGVDTTRLGNAVPYNVQMTQVLYVEGQAALAREVSRRLPLSSELVEMPAGSLTAPVRVVLGHDLRSSSALAVLASQPDAHPALKAAARVGGPNDRLPVPAATAAAQPLAPRPVALKVAAL